MFKNMHVHCFLIGLKKSVLFKCLKQPTLSPLVKTNLSTKTKTYYEILGLQPTATYNEIKSAYYELTLKYHPDKNKSKSAKEIFHEISNAYDILSKYETRKQYDRTLLIKQDLQNIKKEKYKLRNTQLYTSSQPTTTFNFDEWVKQHYTKMFQRSMLIKDRAKIIQEQYENVNEHPSVSFFVIVISLLLLIMYIRECINDRKLQEFKAAQQRRNK